MSNYVNIHKDLDAATRIRRWSLRVFLCMAFVFWSPAPTHAGVIVVDSSMSDENLWAGDNALPWSLDSLSQWRKVESGSGGAGPANDPRSDSPASPAEPEQRFPRATFFDDVMISGTWRGSGSGATGTSNAGRKRVPSAMIDPITELLVHLLVSWQNATQQLSTPPGSPFELLRPP